MLINMWMCCFLGTRKHYQLLLGKLAQMPYFGIEKIVAELQAVLEPAPLKTVLADGRELSYEQMCVMGILNITLIPSMQAAAFLLSTT